MGQLLVLLSLFFSLTNAESAKANCSSNYSQQITNAESAFVQLITLGLEKGWLSQNALKTTIESNSINLISKDVVTTPENFAWLQAIKKVSALLQAPAISTELISQLQNILAESEKQNNERGEIEKATAIIDGIIPIFKGTSTLEPIIMGQFKNRDSIEFILGEYDSSNGKIPIRSTVNALTGQKTILPFEVPSNRHFTIQGDGSSIFFDRESKIFEFEASQVIDVKKPASDNILEISDVVKLGTEFLIFWRQRDSKFYSRILNYIMTDINGAVIEDNIQGGIHEDRFSIFKTTNGIRLIYQDRISEPVQFGSKLTFKNQNEASKISAENKINSSKTELLTKTKEEFYFYNLDTLEKEILPSTKPSFGMVKFAIRDGLAFTAEQRVSQVTRAQSQFLINLNDGERIEIPNSHLGSVERLFISKFGTYIAISQNAGSLLQIYKLNLQNKSLQNIGILNLPQATGVSAFIEITDIDGRVILALTRRNEYHVLQIYGPAPSSTK